MSMSIRSSPRWAVLLAAALTLVAGGAAADEPAATSEADALEAKRERFRAGMEKYRAGAFSEAIDIWEAIYAELGASKGYRLAFNIGRAFEQRAATRSGSAAAITDAVKAAEHYATYV